jgi:hypothetical protein
VLAPPDHLEHGEITLVAGDCLVIHGARLCGQSRDSCHDERKAPSEVIAVAGDQAHTIRFAPSDDAETMVFDFMTRLNDELGPARQFAVLPLSVLT